jgi:PhnB protein
MAERKVKAIPDGYHSLVPFLTLRNAGAAIEFYKKAFGAEEAYRLPGPGGKVMHAELRIGDSVFMMGEEDPSMDASSPQALGGSTGGLMIYCENVDALFERAVKAGAKAQQPPTDMFWGDRYARLTDPFGHRWSMGTHIRDVSPEEMEKAMAEMMKQHAPK